MLSAGCTTSYILQLGLDEGHGIGRELVQVRQVLGDVVATGADGVLPVAPGADVVGVDVEAVQRRSGARVDLRVTGSECVACGGKASGSFHLHQACRHRHRGCTSGRARDGHRRTG